MAPVDPVQQQVRARRAWVLGILVVVGALVLAVRLFDLQVLGVQEYTLQSERNRIRREWIGAPRGLILDRDERVLADSRPSFTVLGIPRRVTGDAHGLAILSGLLELPPEEITERLETGPSHLPRAIRRDVSFAQVSEIAEREEELPGISIRVANVRFYPQGRTAAHVLGHVGEISEEEVAALAENGYRAGDFLGRTGLERSYESELRGTDGERYLEVDAVGRVVGVFAGREPVAPLIGNTLHLHLDLGLQALAESLLTGTRGAACVMDVRTGGLLVLASSSPFDPNHFATGIRADDWSALNEDPDLPLLNRCVQATYAPGSTFKMIPFVLGMKDGLVGLHGEMEVPCFGGYQFGNRYFRCWEETGHGSLDLEYALVQSCDTYFYQLSEMTTVDRLAREARTAGLGAGTGVDLPQELTGNVPDAAWLDRRYGARQWTRGTLLNLVIGQGEYLVTPLQMVRYAGALANGGRLLTPRLVRAIETPDGEITHRETRVGATWEMPPRILAAVRGAMALVVADDDGTGRGARLEGFPSAGKTGTAENPHGPPHSWYVGYAPVDEPRIAFCAIIEGGGHGSDAAVPLVRRLLRRYAGFPEPVS